MDFEKDYYFILGVLPTAELVVIKAAFKALLNVYHPDKFNGLKSEAHAKTIEINEAYSVLSNPANRQEYDNLRSHKDDNTYNYNEESKSKSDFSFELNALEKDWEVAIKYQPELVGIAEALSKISLKLAFTYKAVMIDSQEFINKEKIAKKMEQDYLYVYFGSNKTIQDFAKLLIAKNHRDAARELNKAVTVLGKGIEADRVIEQIKREFDLLTKTEKHDYDNEQGIGELQFFIGFLGVLISLAIIIGNTAAS